MHIRPKTGGTVQSYIRNYAQSQSNWTTSSQVQQTTKNNMFIPTLKAKRQTTRTIQSSKQRVSQPLNKVKLHQINVSSIQESADQDINETIKDLNDFIQGSIEKNYFFEKNILESTKPSEEPDNDMVYQERIKHTAAPQQNYPPSQNIHHDTHQMQQMGTGQFQNVQEYDLQQDQIKKQMQYQEDVKSFQRRRIQMSSARMHQNTRSYSSNYNTQVTQQKMIMNSYGNFYNKTSKQNTKQHPFIVKNTTASMSKRKDSFSTSSQVQNFMISRKI